MAAIMEQHLETRPVLVGENATIADFVTAYTLDMASMAQLLDDLPNLRAYMERMYATAQGTATHRTGVREHPRLTNPRVGNPQDPNHVVTASRRPSSVPAPTHAT